MYIWEENVKISECVIFQPTSYASPSAVELLVI